MMIDKLRFDHSMAMRRHEDFLAYLFQMSLNDAGKRRVDEWLKEAGLINRCLVGVVAVRDYDEKRTSAYVKVIVHGSGSFVHEEPYYSFPSDHFKTKVLLITG
jgi:hypothetical protein